MRKLVEDGVLAVRAIAGLYAVTLAWDFRADDPDLTTDLQGFAIERCQLKKDGSWTSPIWLKGSKRFKDKDRDLADGTLVETSRHPIQSFQWGDYTAYAGVTYRYRVMPTYGTPLEMRLDDEKATTIEVTTEVELGAAGDPNTVRHDIYFNRGAAGSQAYIRKFPGLQPSEEDDPKSDHMAWLSCGLFEALTGFIGRAGGTDAGEYKLRAALYEFR